MSHWLKTQSASEASNRNAAFWQRMSDDLCKDEFWADRIKRFRHSPLERLSLAVDQLPLPAAFRQSLIALRALIREKRKCKAPYERELQLLYWLAAIDSFWLRFSPHAGCSGYSVFESIPGNVICDLNVEWMDLGYAKLPLLNKTDIKWLVELWGEPTMHATLNHVESDVWHHWEEYFLLKRRVEFRAQINAINAAENDQVIQSSREKIVSIPADQLPYAKQPCSECGHSFLLTASRCTQCGNRRTIKIIRSDQNSRQDYPLATRSPSPERLAEAHRNHWLYNAPSLSGSAKTKTPLMRIFFLWSVVAVVILLVYFVTSNGLKS